MYIEKFVKKVRDEPLVFTAGFGVLLLAVFGTSVRHVSSSVFTVLFLLSFTVVKDWGRLYSSLTKLEQIFLSAFLIFTISGILSFYNVDDAEKYYRLFERYLRFSMIVPVYFLIIKKNISVLNYLFAGAVISGPVLLIIALHHYFNNPDVPAQGYYHHIIFGQLAMLNVGIMLCLLLTKKISRQLQLIIIISTLCGLATAVMSQARGVWLVLPVYMAFAIYYAVRDKQIRVRNIAVVMAVFILLLIVTPAGDLVKQRSEDAVSEISRFYTEHQYVSSVGTRLAMWDIAFDVWIQHPMLGTGPGDFDDEIVSLQSKGEYTGMDVHNSVHNIYVQALVGSGIIGLAALLFSVLVMPLKLFLSRCNTSEEGRSVGLITIISFAIFGLSESWTLRLPAISIFLVYMVVIASHVHVSRLKEKSNDI